MCMAFLMGVESFNWVCMEVLMGVDDMGVYGCFDGCVQMGVYGLFNGCVIFFSRWVCNG